MTGENVQAESPGDIGPSPLPVCRICLDTTTDAGDSLISPCGCSGTLANVHPTCLTTWLQASGATSCELCLEPLAAVRRPGTWRDRCVVGVRLLTGPARSELFTTILCLFCLPLSLLLVRVFLHPADWIGRLGLAIGVLGTAGSLFTLLLTWRRFVRHYGWTLNSLWRARRTEGVEVAVELSGMGENNG